MNTINIKQPEGGLLQSKEWTDVLRAEGKNILTVDYEDNKIYCVINKLPIVGTYVYAPRICNVGINTIGDIVEKVKKNQDGWLRIDVCEKELLNKLSEKNIKFVQAPHDMQPRENLIIDISGSEDELLTNMKSKTRYNIRLATKKDVKVFTSRDKKHVDIFCDLVEKTANRKDVSFHDRSHYKKIISKMPSDIIKLYVAEYEEEIIAANIISFYNGVATYLHGATSDNNRNVMAPFLLQWQAIKDAKMKGCQWYDFGGVFPDSDNNGKKGITRFKTGFSPKTETFKTLGSYDVIFSRVKYNLYKLLQQFK